MPLSTNLTEEPIGERIRRIRTEKGLSQRDVTRKTVRISYGYLSLIESGEREPSLQAIRELGRVLDVNPVYIETGTMEYCPHCLRRFTSGT